MPFRSRRSGRGGLARPVFLFGPDGRADMVWPDRYTYWVQRVGPRWFGPTRVPIGPHGRAEMVWPDPCTYSVQTVGPIWFSPTRMPFGSRQSGRDGSARPVYLLGPEGRAEISRPDPTRLGPTGRVARQQVCHKSKFSRCKQENKKYNQCFVLFKVAAK